MRVGAALHIAPGEDIRAVRFDDDRGYLLFLRVSTLDEPHRIVPDVHIFTRSKVPWVGLPPDARAFAEFYELQREWPPESLARRAAASASAAKV